MHTTNGVGTSISIRQVPFTAAFSMINVFHCCKANWGLNLSRNSPTVEDYHFHIMRVYQHNRPLGSMVDRWSAILFQFCNSRWQAWTFTSIRFFSWACSINISTGKNVRAKIDVCTGNWTPNSWLVLQCFAHCTTKDQRKAFNVQSIIEVKFGHRKLHGNIIVPCLLGGTNLSLWCFF
jgi:hypothetical protein